MIIYNENPCLIKSTDKETRSGLFRINPIKLAQRNLNKASRKNQYIGSCAAQLRRQTKVPLFSKVNKRCYQIRFTVAEGGANCYFQKAFRKYKQGKGILEIYQTKLIHNIIVPKTALPHSLTKSINLTQVEVNCTYDSKNASETKLISSDNCSTSLKDLLNQLDLIHMFDFLDEWPQH